MNQIERIEYYKKQFIKVVEAHGADSEYATSAFFDLQAAKMNMPLNDSFKWVEKECERLREITLEQI